MIKSSELLLLIAIICWSIQGTFAQANTVGLLSFDPDKSVEGYTLIYPHNQSSVYLLDKCGAIIHEWTDSEEFRPGNSVYLLENGNLIKCKRTQNGPNDPIWAGGAGGMVEVLSWDNELLHSFALNTENARLHHDVAPLPNGNVLMIAWERLSDAEAIAMGRDSSTLASDELWPDMILEWDIELDSIVWEWHAIDHLIQDYSERAENFGVPSDHPELIDFNYDEHNGHPDWLHINSIDYNPVTDQILLSVPYFNELWVIDHSTTTEEARSHTGGIYGKGGDLLWRWGNAKAYNPTDSTQFLFFQHDAKWTDCTSSEDDDACSMISLYNNRVTNSTSTVNVLTMPSLTDDGDFSVSDQGSYLPAEFTKTYDFGSNIRASSSALSGAQILDNGNALICSGRWGYLFELTPEDELVWEYLVPLKSGRMVEQGAELSIVDNITFRCERYPLDYPPFSNVDTDTESYIEINPNIAFCTLTTTNETQVGSHDIIVYPTATQHSLYIENNEQAVQLHLIDMHGRTVMQSEAVAGINTLDVSELHPGLYWLKLGIEQTAVSKFIKL